MEREAAKNHGGDWEFIVLGSGTCVPTGSRGPASYVFRKGSQALLIDMGAGCLEKLAKCGISYRDIGGVILSHFHVDHTSELPLLLFANNYTPGHARTAPLKILGPEGLEAFLENLEILYPWVKPLHYEIVTVSGTSPSSTFPGSVAVTSCPAAHGDGRALSVRLDTGFVSITYSGDTGYNRDLVALAAKTDLLIVECSFPAGSESEVEGHLTPHLAAKIASRCGAGKVILSHLYPEAFNPDPVASFLEISSAEVIVAHDLLRLTL